MYDMQGEKSSMYQKKSNVKSSIRKRKVVKGELKVDIKNYNSVSKNMHEVIEGKPHEFVISNKLIYSQLLQEELHAKTTYALHWGGDEVIENIPIKRVNKIRSKLSTDSQDSRIYMAGVIGWLAVRHKELNFFLKGKFMENFLTIMVVANTVVLAMDGLFDEPE
jgi:hypothetical protein